MRELRGTPGPDSTCGTEPPSDRLLSLAEVAHVLNLSAKSVHRLAARGSLPCYRIGRLVRFSAGDVFRWLEARREA